MFQESGRAWVESVDNSDQHASYGAASRSSAVYVISDGGRLNPKPRSSTIVLRVLCLDLQELNLKHQSIVPGDERRRPPLAVPYTEYKRPGGDQRQGVATGAQAWIPQQGDSDATAGNLDDQRSRGRWAWRSPSLLGTTRRRISPAHILYKRRHKVREQNTRHRMRWMLSRKKRRIIVEQPPASSSAGTSNGGACHG